MATIRNIAREKLEQGHLSLGCGVRLTCSVEIAIAMKTAGFDWLFLDLEHGTMSIDAAAQIATAALDASIAPLARVPNGEYSIATRLLDNGVLGIVVPHVDTADEAREVVHGRGRGQAPHRLRLPRADHVVPGRGHADGRADRVGGPRASWTGSSTAMIAIKGEIDRVAAEEWPRGRQPARQRAAHCAEPRRGVGRTRTPQHGGLPRRGRPAVKYWPPVRRIDGAYGDRNLVCLPAGGRLRLTGGWHIIARPATSQGGRAGRDQDLRCAAAASNS